MPLTSENTSALAGNRPGYLNLWVSLAISLAAASLLGAGVAALSPGAFWAGWLAAFVLLAPCLYGLLSAWRWAGSRRLLAWLIALAFLLRLGLGIGLSLALPVWGYPEPEQKAGYLFKDAYFRDNQAWELARSDQPLWKSFSDDFKTDQYGGLLALSASIYRFLSPDAHRPFLILILGAFFTALGVPFLYQAARLRFSARAAVIAAWIYVLYPDAIFFGGSQMREPFVVGLAAVAFWAVLAWDWRNKWRWLALVFSLLGMALISNRVAAAVAGVLALLFLLEYIVALPSRRWQILGWIGLVVGVLAVLAFSWEWFRSSSAWDMLVSVRGSGQLGEQIRKLGANDPETLAIEVTYGVAQPVFPAAVAETKSIPFAKTVAIIRSFGWYALAPFLAYGLFAVWKETDPARRRRAVWLALVVSIWIVIASARGGGDMTDNPRYRSLFIPWMALLAAWAVDWALAHRDAWLWRWIAVEVIFLGFFTHWYVSRYFRLWLKLPFWQMVVWIVGLSGLVLVSGWVWDRRTDRKQRLAPRVK